jgi:hypothetical protein
MRMASSMVAMSTEDIGLAAEMRRDDDMLMRLLMLETDDWDERPADDEGEMERGVEMSELDVLLYG